MLVSHLGKSYHDWEHFSSIRNIAGPHQGPPRVVETPQPNSPLRPSRPSLKLRGPKSPKGSPLIAPSIVLRDPTRIPLPRSPSPSSQASSHLTSTSTSSLLTPDDHTRLPSNPTIRDDRSPKRSLDESELDSDRDPLSNGKRLKSGISAIYLASLDDDDLSELSSLPPTPVPRSRCTTPSRGASPLCHVSNQDNTPSSPAAPSADRPLTRRQRKALGLPKPRGPTAGKIIIPGGKHPKRQGKGWVVVSEDERDASSQTEDKEWVKNGTGRMDVRGFKELRI